MNISEEQQSQIGKDLAKIVSEKIYNHIKKKGDYCMALSAFEVALQTIPHHLQKLLDKYLTM